MKLSRSVDHFVFINLLLLFSKYVDAQPQLRDIGVLGLLSHDIFAWDADNETNTENGRIDLSTIFDYENGTRLDLGGNPKNEENAPVFTVTMQMVNFYKSSLATTSSVEVSRRATVAYFHQMVRASFTRMTKLNFPTTGLQMNVTNTEQAVFRGMHDILPGRARYLGRGLHSMIRRSFALTNLFRAKIMLNERELSQAIPDFDGKYDSEYENIRIPFTRIVINLKLADKVFIEKFSAYKQDDMLVELGRVGRGEILMTDVDFMDHAVKLLRKAICPTNNKWMPQDVNCTKPK